MEMYNRTEEQKMDRWETGMLAKSLAGHDKDKVYRLCCLKKRDLKAEPRRLDHPDHFSELENELILVIVCAHHTSLKQNNDQKKNNDSYDSFSCLFHLVPSSRLCCAAGNCL